MVVVAVVAVVVVVLVVVVVVVYDVSVGSELHESAGPMWALVHPRL